MSEPALLDEAAGEAGRTFRIRVIRAGTSLNRVTYPDRVLAAATPLFEGARVFVKSDAEHLAGQGKDFRNLIGRLIEARWEAADADGPGRITASLQVLRSAGDVAGRLTEALERGMHEIFGFSIDAEGEVRTAAGGVREAVKISRVRSVDLIVEPGAGGGLIRLIEAAEAESETRSETMPETTTTTTTNEAEAARLIEARLAEAETAAAERIAKAEAAVAAMLKRSEARAHLREALAGSTLPQAARARLTEALDGREDLSIETVDAAIKGEQAYVATLTEAGKVKGLGGGRVEVADRGLKIGEMLDAFFDPAHKDHRAAQSFRECYIEITGDRRVTGRLEDCDGARLREAMGAMPAAFRESLTSSSFSNILGNSITRRMVANYAEQGIYDVFRALVSTVPVGDFRSQERVRYGGYGALPAVNEGAAYTALSSPTDEKATYAVTKRGGTEDLTLEMITNDDVGVIRSIPMRLATAAKRTLAKFCLDFLRSPPTIYDTVALFHATHGNLGSAALDATSLAAARLAMIKQAEKDSSERLAVLPKYLWVPFDLEETARNLFNRSTNNDKTFLQSLALDIMPVWYWTDVTDWCVSCDPSGCPTIEIGFLNGREEPELFVQDSPSVGSMFTNDKLTWKIRHIYGGAVVDYRGLYKAVVAG